MKSNVFQNKLYDCLDQFKGNIAIEYGQRSLTYTELARRSDRIAHWIIKKGIEPKTFIGILMDDRPIFITTLIGILKAGCVFVPLDTSFPKARVKIMIGTSGVKLIFCDNGQWANRHDFGTCPVEFAAVDDLFAAEESVADAGTGACRTQVSYHPEDPVYVYFTSGSTGTPKAILGKNKSMLHFIEWEVETFAVDNCFRISQLTTPGFDAFLRDIFVPLFAGGTVCIPEDKETMLNAGRMVDWINNNGIRLIHCVPSFFRLINSHNLTPGDFRNLSIILLSGEPIYPSELRKWYDIFGERIQLVNFYGPTETTMIKSFYMLQPSDVNRERIPVGQPMRGARFIICDEAMNLCGELKTGEIYIRTPFMTLGYYNDPELNKKRFLRNPFTDNPNDLLYKTGDLGKLLPDGNIELLGRLDRQVKLRGVRVEPEEIEHVLMTHPSVKEAAVTVEKISGTNDVLCGYITVIGDTALGGVQLAEALKDYLSERLPNYLVPAKIIPVKEILKKPNGKVDYDALMAGNKEGGEEASPLAPRDDVEKKIFAIWTETLENEGFGVDKSFFELGGNSLNIMALLSKIYKEFDVRITLADIFENLTIEKQAEIVKVAQKSRYIPLENTEKKEYYPLTPAQARLYILQQMELENITYNIPMTVTLRGKMDVNRLTEAFRALMRRHESFRTSFGIFHGEICQRVHPEAAFRMEYRGIIHGEGRDGKTWENEFITNFVKPFDISEPPLVRFGLIDARDHHLLMVDMHHIIADGFSQTILARDFMALYNGDRLPELTIHYRDFAEWHKRFREQEIFLKQEEYWLRQFVGELPVLDLPADFARPAAQSFKGGRFNFEVGASETYALKRLAAQNDTTLYVVLLSLFNLFLAKLGDCEDIIIGSPTAGRKDTPLEKIVGMFVNTLPLRNYPNRELQFSDFLSRVGENTVKALENQDYPFEDLVNRVSAGRQANRNPLFDVMFVLHNMKAAEMQVPGLTLEPYDYEHKTSKFDLTLTGEERTDQLVFTFEYCADLFVPGTIEGFGFFFTRVLSTVIVEPSIRLSEVELITREEKKKILRDFNDTSVPGPLEKTIRELFEERVAAVPGNTAVVFENTNLTYRSLNDSANHLAAKLRVQGMGPNSTAIIAAIMIEPSLEMITGIFAILKAGGTFLPIAPDTPRERIKYMLADSAAKLLLTRKTYVNGLEHHTAAIYFDEFERYENKSAAPVSFLAKHFSDYMYLIYTSGTTGRPKGAVITHRNMVNYCFWFQKEYRLEAEDKALLLSSFAFDLGYCSIFPPLFTGGLLHLVPKELYLSAESLLNYIKSNGMTFLKLSPSLLSTFIYSPDFTMGTCASLRLIILGGEPIDVDDVKHLHDIYGHIEVVNEYGPTETTIGTVARFVDLNALDAYRLHPTVGRPIDNSRVYILDRGGHTVPVGVPGELCVAGEGVGEGYLNRPELTRARFSENPFSPGTPFYKTGDRARWHRDGNIQFLGRLDTQVKIRGFRIELEEIKKQLLKHCAIKDAVIMVREFETPDKYLCAYIVVDGSVAVSQLKILLARELPDYMVPAYYAMIEKIPLTPNGKIDYRALPEPVREDALKTTHPAPEDKIGRLLTKIWAEILAVDEAAVGLDANFFEIGGHSLKATLMLSRIYKEFNVKIPLKELFRLPTVRNISGYIGRAGQEPFMSIQPVEEKEHYELSSSQKRIYVLQQLAEESTAYNLSSVVELQGPLDKEKLKQTFVRLIARHEALRTSFHLSEDMPVQRIYRRVDFEIEYYSLEKDMQAAAGGRDKIIRAFMRPFDLSRPPLFRAGLIQIRDRDDLQILMLDMHHIISDGIANGILMQDFMKLYDGKNLAPLNISYKDFSHWQNRLSNSGEMQKQEAFWLKTFAGDIPVLDLPTDYPAPLERSFAGDVVKVAVGVDETRAINLLAAKEKTTLFVFLLGLFYVLLSRLSGREELVVGVPTAGRCHADLYSIIGMFVNTLALKGSPRGELPFLEFLRLLKEDVLGAFENQDYPLERLVEKVVNDRDSHLNPLFDVMFSLDNTAGGLKIEIPGLKLNEIQFRRGTAKFDLTLFAEEVNETLIFSFEYCTDLFKTGTIEKYASYFKRIITSVLSNPGEKISALAIIGEEEKTRLLYDFNATETAYTPGRTIQCLFEEQVQRSPSAVALSHKYKITYGELNKKANQLARVLGGKGVNAGNIVGIMADPSLEMIIGLLAILKAGGAYIPIDPGYPPERVGFMIKNSGVRLLLIRDRFSNKSGITVDSVVLENSAYYNGDGADLENVNTPYDPVYIIYTSGSTGAAKGILLEHRALVNYVKWAEKYYLKGEKIDFPLYSSLSFDLTVTSIYVPLVSGNKILVYDWDDNEFVIEKIVHEGKAGIIKLTPTHLGILSQLPLPPAKNSIRKIIVGGEELTTEIAGKIAGLLGGDIEIFNEYGPTEATVGCMIHRFEPAGDSGRTVPIGVPIDNAKIYILDQGQAPVLPGVTGELCVSGDGLARGYLNRPELTAEKFILNPFVPGRLLYRTGDTARWLPGGNLEFLGRLDDQVKIRGHRVEPGEIEYHLALREDIKEAAVIAGEDTAGSGGTFLCAYLVSRRQCPVSELKEYLAAKVPSHMVPAYFVFLEKMPLTASGKINRRALPGPVREVSGDYTAPESAVEKKLAEAWQTVLGIPGVGIHDNFFQLGGDSVKAIQVSSRLMRAGLKLQIRDIFRTPTIGELARCVRQMDLVIQQGPVVGEVTPGPIQRWFFQNAFSEMHHFNQSVMIYNPNGFLEKEIRDIFSEIVRHHDALRMVTGTVGGKTVLRIRGCAENNLFDFQVMEMNDLPGSDARRLIEVDVERLARSIDLKNGPLVKLGLYKTAVGDYLLMVIHHLVVDGISWRILFEDFSELSRQIAGGRPLKLPPKTTSFKEWTEKLAAYADSKKVMAELPYWLGIEQTFTPPLSRDRTVSGRKRRDSSKLSFGLSEQYTRCLLMEAHAPYKTEIIDILLAALGLALRDWQGNDKFVIDLEGHGREDIIEGVDISRTVGWFTSLFPVVLDMTVSHDIPSFIKETKEMLRRVPNKGIGYGILKYLTPAAGGADAVFGAAREISFNYLGQFDESFANSGFQVADIAPGSPVSLNSEKRYALEMTGILHAGKLVITVDYCVKEYDEARMRRFLRHFETRLQETVDHCADKKEAELTPSDLSSPGLSGEEFETIIDELEMEFNG